MKKTMIKSLIVALWVVIITTVVYFTPYAQKVSVVYFGWTIWASLALGVILTPVSTFVVLLVRKTQIALVRKSYITKEEFASMFVFGAVLGIIVGIVNILSPALPEQYYMPAVAVFTSFVVWVIKRSGLHIITCLVFMALAFGTTIAVERLAFLVGISLIVLILERTHNYLKK